MEQQKRIHMHVILRQAGYQMAKHPQPGYEIKHEEQYSDIATFVRYKDFSGKYDIQTQMAMLKNYQEVLAREGIPLEFLDSPIRPYLAGIVTG